MHLTYSMDHDNFNRVNVLLWMAIEWYGNQHLAFEFTSLFQLISFCSFFQFLIFMRFARVVVFSFYVLFKCCHETHVCILRRERNVLNSTLRVTFVCKQNIYKHTNKRANNVNEKKKNGCNFKSFISKFKYVVRFTLSFAELFRNGLWPNHRRFIHKTMCYRWYTR